ncbi:MAG: hypothetical protein QOI63_1551 [Thermoplasmata archaeon]|nr:hypothetical protein [Thermoplasmata archaeon]
MGVVDSSLLLDLFDADSPSHRKAQARLSNGTLAITPGVLSEVTQAIRRRATAAGLDGSRAARDMLAALRALPGYLFVVDADDEAIASLHAANSAMSYVDAWGIWLARKTGEELWTHDRAQSRVFRRSK